MTTIKDVARAAGVAASTVSRYLNGQLRVSPTTEAKVLEAVAELGYVPNAAARNLARRRSGVIGFVVPEISNPYFGTIADYVVEAVERHGRLVLLCSHRSQSVKQSSYIDLLATGAIDGMLYLGSFRWWLPERSWPGTSLLNLVAQPVSYNYELHGNRVKSWRYANPQL